MLEKDENVIVEYGNKDLKEILEDFIQQKYIEMFENNK